MLIVDTAAASDVTATFLVVVVYIGEVCGSGVGELSPPNP